MFRNKKEQNKKNPELIIKINIKGMIPDMHKPKEETLFKCIVGSCPGAWAAVARKYQLQNPLTQL